LVAWWFLFWPQVRKHQSVTLLVLIPSTVCSVGVPDTVSEVARSLPTVLLPLWFALPIPLMAAVLMAGMDHF